MKRYKDCFLFCNVGQVPDELLDVVERVSTQKGYELQRYSTIRNRDTLAVYLREKGYPHSRLIVCTDVERGAVSIVNIVPTLDSEQSHIDYTEYNKMLDSFRDKVFVEINERQGNLIEENAEDYTLEETIPKSFPALNTWLNNFPLSGHPFDERRWDAFVVALHMNEEHLSTDDFREYISENYNWDDKTISRFCLKLEDQLALLEYYDEYLRKH